MPIRSQEGVTVPTVLPRSGPSIGIASRRIRRWIRTNAGDSWRSSDTRHLSQLWEQPFPGPGGSRGRPEDPPIAKPRRIREGPRLRLGPGSNQIHPGEETIPPGGEAPSWIGERRSESSHGDRVPTGTAPRDCTGRSRHRKRPTRWREPGSSIPIEDAGCEVLPRGGKVRAREAIGLVAS